MENNIEIEFIAVVLGIFILYLRNLVEFATSQLFMTGNLKFEPDGADFNDNNKYTIVYNYDCQNT